LIRTDGQTDSENSNFLWDKAFIRTGWTEGTYRLPIGLFAKHLQTKMVDLATLFEPLPYLVGVFIFVYQNVSERAAWRQLAIVLFMTALRVVYEDLFIGCSLIVMLLLFVFTWWQPAGFREAIRQFLFTVIVSSIILLLFVFTTACGIFMFLRYDKKDHLWLVVNLVLVFAHWWRETEITRLTESNDKLRSSFLCTVCLNNPRDVILLPCGHLILCGACALRIQDMGNCCPVCREEIDWIQSAYIS
jgi:Zinc finger, C3HC4 type (RING finger)